MLRVNKEAIFQNVVAWIMLTEFFCFELKADGFILIIIISVLRKVIK